MKTVKIAELKSRLSHFLSLVKKGEPILVTDRTEPVAELIPIRVHQMSKREALIREGKIIPATSKRELEISKIKNRINVAELLSQDRDE